MQGAPSTRFHSLTPVVLPDHSANEARNKKGLMMFGGLVKGVGATLAASLTRDHPTNAAWLYLEQEHTWIPVNAEHSAEKPPARYKHGCSALPLDIGLAVCFGGVDANGGALADTWLLLLHRLHIRRRTAVASWTQLDTAARPLGARHSFVSAPGRTVQMGSARVPESLKCSMVSVMVVGGTTQNEDPTQPLSMPSRDMVMMDGC
jgi:hypothetical protein